MLIVRRFLSDNSGATAVEYGLIAAGIAAAIIVIVVEVGTKVSGTFTTIESEMK